MLVSMRISMMMMMMVVIIRMLTKMLTTIKWQSACLRDKLTAPVLTAMIVVTFLSEKSCLLMNIDFFS